MQFPVKAWWFVEIVGKKKSAAAQRHGGFRRFFGSKNAISRNGTVVFPDLLIDKIDSRAKARWFLEVF